jgi:hypothetical protein
VQPWAAREVFDERQDQSMNRLWRRLDVTVTLIAQGSGRLPVLKSVQIESEARFACAQRMPV